MKKYVFPLIFIFVSCAGNTVKLTTQEEKQVQKVLASKPHMLSSYSTDALSKPLYQRILTAPDFLVKYLIEFDNMPGYKPYAPTAKQLAEISNNIEMLPPYVKKVMQERLLGFYFIDTFLGSGMADFCVDGQGEIYFFIFFNPEILNHSFSEWVTMKDITCFIPDVVAEMKTLDGKNKAYSANSIEIAVSGNYTGFFYTLLHEGTHGVDYVKNITPYIEEIFRSISIFFNKPVKDASVFTKNVWDGIKSPVPEYKFPLRKSITVFGWGGGPKIPMKDAPEVYQSLAGTPFVTLYGATSWAEDLAEFVTYYHMTQKLGQTYTITVKSNGKAVFSYSPMTNDMVKARFASVQLFYQ
ncbi:MAG: hypothetical protein HPY53_13805 [Brevinematales bacterium]|nr:hypothetical protein [Brevinematales bacterium]